MKTRITALALLLCLCLTACGEDGDGGGQPSLLETASGLEETTVLLTIDGREVPAWRYLYWLAYTCDQIAEQYAAAELSLDWDTALSGGSTLADSAKEQALADTALYATVENWAETYSCTPPERSEEPTVSILPDLGLTEAQQEELAAVGQLYAELYALYHTADSPLAPAAEDLAAYGRELGAITLDRILVPAGEDRDSARQRAAALFSQLNSAEDQAATFTTLAADGGDPAGPRTLLPGDGSLDETLWEAAEALGEGQISGILESEDGFSILRRLPLDTAALADSYFDHQLEAAAQSADISVTPAYETLDPAAFSDALRQARQQAGTA